MTETRLSTVFDYSNLRLHPDGTRVYQKSTNLIPRIAKSVVRTSRNNWIARDAGGLANIRKFKTTSQHLQGDEEAISLRTGINSEDEENELEEEGKKRKAKRLDKRMPTRQKFLENYDYLTDAGTDTFPYEPSSDLLKCIHRYAAEYYTESGQLLNCSRDYRKQKKKRRDERKAKDRTATSTSPRNSRTSTPRDGSLGSESDTSIQDYGNEGSSRHKLEEMDKPQRKRRQPAKQYRDMYKLFDGSAIMAIGMLVQEYIAEALDPQPPGEWDEEILKAFTSDCTSEDEGDATDADIDGSNSNAEIDSDEQSESSCQSDDNGSE